MCHTHQTAYVSNGTTSLERFKWSFPVNIAPWIVASRNEISFVPDGSLQINSQSQTTFHMPLWGIILLPEKHNFIIFRINLFNIPRLHDSLVHLSSTKSKEMVLSNALCNMKQQFQKVDECEVIQTCQTCTAVHCTGLQNWTTALCMCILEQEQVIWSL